jgi:transcriptional regulator with XRE-family HTH domain
VEGDRGLNGTGGPGALPRPARSYDAPMTTTLGSRLRQLRRERNRSLQDVADATGISVSFLSHIENDKSDLTVNRMLRLASYYGVDISELLPDGTGGDPVVVRKGEQQHYFSPSEHIEIALLGPRGAKEMQPMDVSFEPGGHAAEYARHDGAEFLHVLSGAVRVELEGHEPFVLEAGDSAYYRADRAHKISSVGDEGARLFAVVSPPHSGVPPT